MTTDLTEWDKKQYQISIEHNQGTTYTVYCALRIQSEPYLVGAPVPHRVQGQANDARPRDVSSHRITHQAIVVVTWIAASIVRVLSGIAHGQRVLLINTR